MENIQQIQILEYIMMGKLLNIFLMVKWYIRVLDVLIARCMVNFYYMILDTVLKIFILTH